VGRGGAGGGVDLAWGEMGGCGGSVGDIVGGKEGEGGRGGVGVKAGGGGEPGGDDERRGWEVGEWGGQGVRCVGE